MNVSAFLASGNVIFSSQESDDEVVAKEIESGLRQSLGYEVPTFLRSGDEVTVIAAHSPFPGVDVGDRGNSQVAMFIDPLDDDASDAVLELSTELDMLELVSRDLYWSPAGNFLDSELDLKVVEKITGPFTVRTKRTVERIVTKL